MVTYNGATSVYTVYKNGVPVGTLTAFSNGQYVASNTLYTDFSQTTPLGNINLSSDPPVSIIIGTWPAGLFGISATLGSNGCFLGQMDELRVYNKALTQNEIEALYLNGKAGR